MNKTLKQRQSKLLMNAFYSVAVALSAMYLFFDKMPAIEMILVLFMYLAASSICKCMEHQTDKIITLLVTMKDDPKSLIDKTTGDK